MEFSKTLKIKGEYLFLNSPKGKLEGQTMPRLGKEYTDHKVFRQLSEFADFYDSLAHATMGFISQGTKAILNLDTYVFSSVKGTLESIKLTLLNGRINDS